MKKAIAIIVGLVILVVLLVFSMTFSLAFNQVAVQSRFGRVDESSIVREPGLHFRLPFFADAVHRYDTRLQILESPLGNIQTADGQQVAVKGFMLWRVNAQGDGPLEFYRSFVDIDMANPALKTQFRDAMSLLSEYRFDELLGKDSQLSKAEGEILARMKDVVSEGVEPVTVGVSRIVYKESTTTEVVRRMQSERATQADAERTRGTAEAKRIQSDADAISEKILAFATQRAQEIRTRGEERTAQYLTQMSQDEDLAVFLLWLDALERSLSRNTTFVIDTATEPWHLLEADGSESGLPVPGGKADSGDDHGG